MKIDGAGAVLTGFFSRPTTNEPSNRYSGGENEDYSNRPRMSHDKPQGYGANPTYGSAGDPSPAYSSGYASGGQTYGAPGAGGEYRGTETYAPTGQAPGGAEGYGYSSGGPRHEGVEQRYGGRDSSYKSSEPDDGSKSSSGYNPSYGGPRDDGDGDRYSGISSGYKPPGSEYGAKSGSGYGASQAYGGRQGGGDNDKYPGHGYTAPDSDTYGTESQFGYNAPQSDGGPRRSDGDTDEYGGKKGSGYQTPKQDTYGSKNSAGYNASQSYGASRRGDGDEPSGRPSQYSSTSGGANAPSGGFLSGSGDASRRDDSKPGTNTTYGGRGSGYGGRGSGTAEPPYDSNTTSGYNAPRRDQDTYPGTQSQGPPRRDNLGDVETDARYKQHFDAHAQAYG